MAFWERCAQALDPSRGWLRIGGGGGGLYFWGPNFAGGGVEGESWLRVAQENTRLNAENEREAQENTRLNSENERLFRKNQEHSESREAMLGFILDSRNKLERATRLNTLRPSGFPFADWHPHLVENAIALCLRAGHYESLKWVTERPNWQSILSEDTAKAVRTAVASRNDMVAEISCE